MKKIRLYKNRDLFGSHCRSMLFSSFKSKIFFFFKTRIIKIKFQKKETIFLLKSSSWIFFWVAFILLMIQITVRLALGVASGKNHYEKQQQNYWSFRIIIIRNPKITANTVVALDDKQKKKSYIFEIISNQHKLLFSIKAISLAYLPQFYLIQERVTHTKNRILNLVVLFVFLLKKVFEKNQ